MPIVAVLGATGLQGARTRLDQEWSLTTHPGSAVIRGLLQDGTFTPRALSRNLESDASRALRAQGVEVVKADADDKDSLVAAFTGCAAVFAVRASLGELSVL